MLLQPDSHGDLTIIPHAPDQSLGLLFGNRLDWPPTPFRTGFHNDALVSPRTLAALARTLAEIVLHYCVEGTGEFDICGTARIDSHAGLHPGLARLQAHRINLGLGVMRVDLAVMA